VNAPLHKLSDGALLLDYTHANTAQYDIFAIGLVTSMIGIVYYGGSIPSDSDTAIKVATSAGTVIGQLGFGALADLVGRKRMVRDFAILAFLTGIESNKILSTVLS
jgi:MFS family permease